MGKILIMLLLVSCGKLKHEVKPVEINTDIPSEISVDLGFEKAAKFCDDRYGTKTPDSEACFQDYRNFAKLSIGLDLSTVVDFCDNQYTQPNLQEGCVSDLVALLNGLLNRGSIE